MRVKGKIADFWFLIWFLWLWGCSNGLLSPKGVNFEALLELEDDPLIPVATETDNQAATEPHVNKQGYVSQSAVALRCRVMPPPCMRNPYIKDASENDIDPFGDRRSECAVFLPATFGGDGLSRYRTVFHEIEQIGTGNFSRVFKVLKRIDGCMYAVKCSTRKLYLDTERQKALMEVQALAALGYHDNIVGYNTSWFENEQLYIQMELCDHSLSINHSSRLCLEGQVLEAMQQVLAEGPEAYQEYCIRHTDGFPVNSDAERQRVIQCLEAAIERRVSEVDTS